MRKKVIDIYPPINNNSPKKSYYIGREKRKIFSNGKVILSLAVFFLFFLGYLYYSSYGTQITIHPVSVNMTEAKEVLVRGSGSVGNQEIRGVVFSKRISGSREFEIEETVVIEQKAQGDIEVCQDYREISSNYVQGTRFISDEGKMFEAIEGFVLPGINNNGGCAFVSVVAVESGEDYNLGKNSSFALPGLDGTSIYGRVKGKSFNLKVEGFSKEVPHLSDDAMEKAEREIREELFKEGMEIIQEEYSKDYFVEEDIQYNLEIIEKDFEENEEGETFNFKLKARIDVIAIGNDNIENFIYTLLPENHTWNKNESEKTLSFQRVNFERKEADINITFRGQIYKKIDKEGLKREIAGLNFIEAEEKIKEKVETEMVDIKASPFGISKVVNNLNRINIVLEFDKL